MSINLSDYHFDLPEEYIAKYPPKERDGGRLMVVPKCWEKDAREHQPGYRGSTFVPGFQGKLAQCGASGG